MPRNEGSLVTVGVAMVTGQMLFLFAMRSREAGLVAPFIYATLIFMMLFDFGVLGVVPDLISLAGAGVIITCGSYIAIREHLQDTRQRNDVSGRLILIISSAPSCIEYDHAGNAPRHNRPGCSHCR